jgi:hypothetical protein
VAERISSLPDRPLGAPPKYPWDTWTDGSAWRIQRGIDYDIPSTSMASMIRGHAARHGFDVVALVNRERDAVEFQFRIVDGVTS